MLHMPFVKRTIYSNLCRLILVVAGLTLAACGGGGGGSGSGTNVGADVQIDPSDANALTSALVIPGASNVSGAPPSPSGTPSAPTVSRSETDVSYTSGSQVMLPVDYSATQDVTQIIYSVQGADSFFTLDLDGAGSNGTVVLPVTIPASVIDGDFCSSVRFVDQNGEVSAPAEICITVIQPLACNETKVSGGEGVTSTIVGMNGDIGNIKIDYQTYVIKDKIDVFQNNQWIGGTGPYTDRNSIRTALDCSAATEALGYVGENSEFVFAYDPTVSGNVEIVVSGCENNGTAWELTASCPGDYPLTGGSIYGIWDYSDEEYESYDVITQNEVRSYWYIPEDGCYEVDRYDLIDLGGDNYRIEDEYGYAELKLTVGAGGLYLDGIGPIPPSTKPESSFSPVCPWSQ